jgi:hypothetical protein
MGVNDLMNAAGNLRGNLDETDCLRLLRHGQPPKFVVPPSRGLIGFPTKGSFLELVNRYSGRAAH